MITASTFFSETLKSVDFVIAHFVELTYNHFVQANSEVIAALFTFYIMFLAYQFLFQPHHFSLSLCIRNLVVMLSVYGLIMNWSLYHLFVYKIFTQEPENIAKILINASSTQTNIIDALDIIYATIVKSSMELFGQINFSMGGVAFIIYGCLVFIIGSLMCVFALILFIYAKMMMAIALALGPIFILFILWNATKGLFSAWLNTLITIALIPIITSAILVLMLSVIHITLPNINEPISNMQFYGIAPFLGLSLATTLILSQVFRICSALGGGITLASVSAATTIIHHSLEKSGLKTLGTSSINWTKNKFRRKKSGE